ncbi:hypothetical protein C0J52_28313 [Blattella germanica]|nr:hypothetical protein C0J52_28313 [Blattella germanica]
MLRDAFVNRARLQEEKVACSIPDGAIEIFQLVQYGQKKVYRNLEAPCRETCS